PVHAGRLDHAIHVLLRKTPRRGIELDDPRSLEQAQRIEVRGEMAAAAVRVDERPDRRHPGHRRERDRAGTREQWHRAGCARHHAALLRARLLPPRLRRSPIPVARFGVSVPGGWLDALPVQHVVPARIYRIGLVLELIVDLVEKTERAAELEDVANHAAM